MSAVAVKRDRLELAAEAGRLRAQGMTARQIAEQLGVSRSYASALCTDPDGAKDRARKQRYAGTCERCGAPTTGSDGRANAPKTCAPCRAALDHEQAYWTRERIIEEIQRFAREHGRPPVANDWNHANRDAGYPPTSRVYNSTTNQPPLFPSWADAIEAAGFPRPTIVYERMEETRARLSAALTVWTQDAIIAELQAWASEHGEAPARSEWVKDGRAPCTETIVGLFGSWPAAQKAAGLEPRRLKPGRIPRNDTVARAADGHPRKLAGRGEVDAVD